jgi:hypothetical protein
MLFYLSGSIEYSPDRGRKWRADITPFLQSLGHEVYDPAQDERKNLTSDEVTNFRSWKKSDLPRFQHTLRKIIAWDLDYVEKRSDAVLCFWDEHAQRGAGTQAELTLAHRMGVPVYLVSDMEVSEVSGWILGCASHLFADFEQFKAHIAQNTPQPQRARLRAMAAGASGK